MPDIFGGILGEVGGLVGNVASGGGTLFKKPDEDEKKVIGALTLAALAAPAALGASSTGTAGAAGAGAGTGAAAGTGAGVGAAGDVAAPTLLPKAATVPPPPVTPPPSGPGFLSTPGGASIAGAGVLGGAGALQGALQAKFNARQREKQALAEAAKLEAQGGVRSAENLTGGTQSALGQILASLGGALR